MTDPKERRLADVRDARLVLSTLRQRRFLVAEQHLDGRHQQVVPMLGVTTDALRDEIQRTNYDLSRAGERISSLCNIVEAMMRESERARSTASLQVSMPARASLSTAWWLWRTSFRAWIRRNPVSFTVEGSGIGDIESP